MSRRIIIITAMCWFAIAPSIAMAGSLSDLNTAISDYYSTGDISDADVKAILNDLVTQASSADTPEAEASYRFSFIDIVNAYRGTSITPAAADALQQLARP